MANAYLLNGTVSQIRVRVNNGTDISLDALDMQTPNRNSTAKLDLASSPRQGVLGIGSNEVLVIINGISTKWNVVISSPPVIIALDVQLIIFANALQPKNTVDTAGFTITKITSSEVEARSEGGETPEEGMESTQLQEARRPPAVRGMTSADPLNFKFLASDVKGALYEASNNNTSGAEVAWIYYYLLDRKSTRLNSSHGYISYAV